jgi:hypothetical protein
LIKEHANRLPFSIAVAYGFRGERDPAFQWLERAYAQKESDLQYIKGHPALRNLEADPRYKPLLRKMNLPVRDDVAD